ncbi:uncharacterized protein LOC143291581 [Babylonia areolata]|uniref:uncharacterized protein LOC143291581 n=1 Tax=Babylonia areolata TaxID=304850 RepID=UPI003FD4AB36
MEETQWTKNELFSWNEGRRIVDLCELSRQLLCKKCTSLLDLRRTEREARYGLASVLYILCNCGMVNDVHTGSKQHRGPNNVPEPVYEVNTKASLNLVMYGSDASRILHFLALLDIPVPPPDDRSLTVPVKADTDAHSQSNSLPCEMPPTSTSPATSLSIDSEVSKSWSLLTTSLSSCAYGSSSVFNSVPCMHPFKQNCDSARVSSDNCYNNNNGCDNSDSVSPVGHTGFHKRMNDGLLNDISKMDNEKRENSIKRETGNRTVQENIEGRREEEDSVPPMKIKSRSRDSHKVKKSSSKMTRKTHAREPLKLVVQRIAPRTRAKLKKASAVETVEEQRREELAENNEIDFSNTMEWSSTESEPEAETSQDRDSDASWQGAEKREQEKPKRGRGRPKGSTDKVKRVRRQGPCMNNPVSKQGKQAEGGMEANSLPKCVTCDKHFNSSKGYNLHMKRVHSQDGHNQEEHNQELRNAEAKAPLGPQDDKRQRGKRGSKAQVPLWQTVKEEKVTDSLYMCPDCSLLYSQASCLIVHLKKAHQRETTQVESYGIPLEGSVMKLKRVWKGDSDHVRTCYQCLKCDAIIHHHRKFAQHIRVGADGQVTCEALCPEGKGLRSYQRTLFLKGHRNYLCHTCGASFTERDTFHHHIETHGEAVAAKKYRCQFCPYSATRQLRMVNHVMSKHSSAPRPRPHVCEQCGKGFFNRNMLSQHTMDVHVREKRYQCHLCPKVFLRRHKLTVHVRLHSGVRPFACDSCGQTFTAAYNLKVHQRLHTGEKPYCCAHCEAAFAQKSSLDVHMKKHGLGPTRRSKNTCQASSRPTSPPHSITAGAYPPTSQTATTPLPPSPRAKTPPPPSPPSSQVPPVTDCTDLQKRESPLAQYSPVQPSPPPPPPLVPMDFPLHQQVEPQQAGDFHHHPTVEAGSPPHPLRLESEAAQHPRVESYMYPGHSGVVFPGLPSTSYPFYPNL